MDLPKENQLILVEMRANKLRGKEAGLVNTQATSIRMAGRRFDGLLPQLSMRAFSWSLQDITLGFIIKVSRGTGV